MGKEGKKKQLTEQEITEAIASVQPLNAALKEVFGDLEDPQLLIWVSDLHISHNKEYPYPDGWHFYHFDPSRQFKLAMHEINALEIEPELMLMGGDMTNHGLPEEWEVFREVMDSITWDKPIFPAMGNHDNGYYNYGRSKYPSVNSSNLSESWEKAKNSDWPSLKVHDELYYSVEHKGYKYIVIDTLYDPEYRMTDEQLNWLSAELAETRMPTLMMCHQHVLPNGNDELKFNDLRTWKLIDECPYVLGFFSGHVHCDNVFDYRDKLYVTFPSTAYGVGQLPGWGGIMLSEGKVVGLFSKDTHGFVYEKVGKNTISAGEFRFLQAKRFVDTELYDPNVWPGEKR